MKNGMILLASVMLSLVMVSQAVDKEKTPKHIVVGLDVELTGGRLAIRETDLDKSFYFGLQAEDTIEKKGKIIREHQIICEKFGKMDGILSIGAVVMDDQSNIMTDEDGQRLMFQRNLESWPKIYWEERCCKEFWDTPKATKALAFVLENQEPRDTVMKDFVAFLKKAEGVAERYNISDAYQIVATCPETDTAWLNYYIQNFSDGKPIIYRQTGDKFQFQRIINGNSFLRPLMIEARGDAKTPANLGWLLGLPNPQKFSQSHIPLEDAKVAAHHYNEAVKFQEVIRTVLLSHRDELPESYRSMVVTTEERLENEEKARQEWAKKQQEMKAREVKQ